MKNGLDKKKDILVTILTTDPESRFRGKDRIALLQKTTDELLTIFKSEFKSQFSYEE